MRTNSSPIASPSLRPSSGPPRLIDRLDRARLLHDGNPPTFPIPRGEPRCPFESPRESGCARSAPRSTPTTVPTLASSSARTARRPGPATRPGNSAGRSPRPSTPSSRASPGDEVLRDLAVVDVEPAPDAARLLVTVTPRPVGRPRPTRLDPREPRPGLGLAPGRGRLGDHPQAGSLLTYRVVEIRPGADSPD